MKLRKYEKGQLKGRVVLPAPFPYFGGKAKIAAEVWQRFGEVKNYVEPFFGSGAVLLQRPDFDPDNPPLETVNDLDCFLVNFWRAMQAEPDRLAEMVDWPVNEIDLFARHLWLVRQPDKDEFIEHLRADPDFYDVKRAAWWCWGLCQWIGRGWCHGSAPYQQLPNLGNLGKGVHRRLPHLGDLGVGVQRKATHGCLNWFRALQTRLRRVRVCCGDWSRVLGPSVTFKHGLTAVFLDPPYTYKADRKPGLYTEDDGDVDRKVHDWAVENGGNPLLRIAVCGYEGTHEFPTGWTKHRWQARGGYGCQGEARGRANREREVIWFSPHCRHVRKQQLF